MGNFCNFNYLTNMQGISPHNLTLLLKRVAEDNEEAFRELFDRYKSSFYAVAFRMSRSAYVAEEIVQEVFVQIWLKRQLIAEAKNPSGYLITILHNCVYAHFRKSAKEKRIQDLLTETRQEHEPGPEWVLLEKEHRGLIEKIINRLPPQQKTIYKLAKQEGISREKIANQLNLSPNTVRNHLAAAVEYLRISLKKGISGLFLTIMIILS